MRQRLQAVKQKHGVYFIAELGQNHQGSLAIAKKMVDSLVGTGVAAIKTAKRDIDVCLTKAQKEMAYIGPQSFGATYYEHRKALELSLDDFRELKRYAEQCGFDFISSFTDKNSLDFLVEIGVKTLKIASQRLTDIPLLLAAAQSEKPIIISTGMSAMQEVDRAVVIFEMNEKYLLQCTSTYPCEPHDINLAVIKKYRNRYKEAVDGYGLSGHHVGVIPDVAAFLFGAEIIERHYTLHRHWKGTDHAASLEKKGVEYIMKYIQEVRQAIGDDKKRILESELPAIHKLRAK